MFQWYIDNCYIRKWYDATGSYIRNVCILIFLSFGKIFPYFIKYDNFHIFPYDDFKQMHLLYQDLTRILDYDWENQSQKNHCTFKCILNTAQINYCSYLQCFFVPHRAFIQKYFVHSSPVLMNCKMFHFTYHVLA